MSGTIADDARYKMAFQNANAFLHPGKQQYFQQKGRENVDS